MNVIASMATAVPENKHRQADLAAFMCELYQYADPQKKKLKLLYARSAIETRHSVIPDYSSTMEERAFFPKTRNLLPFPNLEYRMQYFNKTALHLAVKAIEDCVEGKIKYSQIIHLITVSCTGLSAPGLDVDLVQHLHLNENIHRSSINFMGCYAAIHALKQADYICKSDPDSRVLIVCVELCTLHFQKADDQDNIMANLLFADGAAAALIVPEGFAQTNQLHGFGLKNFHAQLSLNGKNEMAWQLSSTGFLMTLSSYIPELIERGIKNLFEKAAQHLQIKKQEIKHWAIHPGGRKVLEVIQKELELDDEALASSYKVLKDYGNMSSPTILFVLKHLWEEKVIREEKEITFAVAFGPGLTMESIMLENV